MTLYDRTLARFSRRELLKIAWMLGASAAAPPLATRRLLAMPFFDAYPFTLGVASGDPLPDGVVLWTRLAPKPLDGGGMPPVVVGVEWEVARDPRFGSIAQKGIALAHPELAHSVHVEVSGLESGRDYWYRFRAGSEISRVGRTRTAPPTGAPVDRIRFAVCGCNHYEQGYFTAFRRMAEEQFDFVFHTGDYIYEGRPEPGRSDRVRLHLGQELFTLVDYRNRYALYKSDPDLLAAHASAPWVVSWDDHEVSNNWSDSKDLSGDARYSEKNVPLLVARGARAFLEYAPMRPFDVRESQRVYRKYSYGPLLELFVLDMRSYRGPNSANLQTTPGADTAFLGREQLDWLKAGLNKSRAVWKVIAADMPLGLNVGDGMTPQGQARWEAVANGEPGAAKGRELEFAELLSYLKRRQVHNVVWLTADVHYCAAHFYDPSKAAFRDFDPFWEFVAGPLNAGTFGPNVLDGTFGPQAVFIKAPAPGLSNLSPLSGMQFFGEVNVQAHSADLTVDLRDINGTSVFSRRLQPRS